MKDNYGVYITGSTDGERMYKNYNIDPYQKGEVIAIFGSDYALAKEFAENFKGYSGNVKASICLLHESARVGDDYSEFWQDRLPEQVKDGWIKYYDSLDQ